MGKLEKTSSQKTSVGVNPYLGAATGKPKGKQVYKHLSTQQGTEKGEGAPRRFGGTQPVNGSDLTGVGKGERRRLDPPWLEGLRTELLPGGFLNCPGTREDIKGEGEKTKNVLV